MLVKIHDPRLNMWSFVRPFSWNLWLSIAMFSAFIGAIILFMERNVRKDSTLENSSWRKRCITGGSVLWLPAVQAVFPKRESLTKTSSRFVLMMWLILVFVLMQSYTACLSSILIVHELQPQYLSENDVIKDSNINVGYKSGSFVGDLLVNKLTMGDESRVKNYYGIEEYKEALDKGSHNDGVDAIFDESPYFKTFLHRYGSKNYAVVGTSLHYGGFGFAFRKGSNLTAYFSEAILNITESNVIMKRIEETYFGDSDDDDGKEDLYNSPSHDVSPSLTAYSFAGLFVVIGILSLLALLVSEMLAKVDSQRLLSPSSARLSPLEEGSETRNNVDEECSADTQNIGSENGGDNKTLPV
ncbi:glutamate receptor 2.9-like [Neltuma alba]|nr:glutamate receptor 2.9-like [Prosopis alba]